VTRAALLPLAAGAGAAPTLLFPGLEGDASAFAPLAARWPGPGPLWALQPRGVADDHLPLRRVESITADLLQHVADRWSDGNVDRWSKTSLLLAGWSFGGLLAWEAGWTLARAGASVHVAILDTRALLGESPPRCPTSSVEAAHAEALRRYQPPPSDLPLTVF
jgi:thioesterase domain-containing protein